MKFNAYEVSKSIASGVVDGFSFHFGVDNAKVAAQLRKLADAIERETEIVLLTDAEDLPQIIVERVTHETTAERDDFTTSKITIVVAERIKA